jgi:hypothetical protein
MRSDISKIVVERPRAGSRNRFGDARKKLYNRLDSDGMEHAPTKVGYKRSVDWSGGYSKNLSDHLSPLYGFIRKSVGRPWNKVYSEICANLRSNSTSHQHVRSHIFDFVEIHVEMRGKVPWHKSHEYTISGPIGMGRTQFYVNPNTGLLCEAPTYKRERYRKEPLPIVDLGPNEMLRKVNGIWYYLHFDTFVYKETVVWFGDNDNPYTVKVPDIPKHARVDLENLTGKGDKVYIDVRRTANKRELRKHNLLNDYVEPYGRKL